MEQELEKDSGRDMTPQLIKDLGMRYPTEKSRQRYKYGLYKCAYCGKEFETKFASIKGGTTKSCGCLLGVRHGLSFHRLYDTWKGMVTRCKDVKNKDYVGYGGRGITVCEEWLDVRNFVAWADITYIEGMTLDRIDNDKGYSPENCRWVNKITQSLNQRVAKNNTSGYIGVYWFSKKRIWVASISIEHKLHYIGKFLSKEEAVQARDQYILDNNLPNKLSTDYIREES